MSCRTAIVILAIGAGVACGGAGAASAGEANDDRLRAAVAGYDSAWQAKDSARAARYLASDNMYFTSDGGQNSRAESFGSLGGSTYRLTRSHRSDLAIALTGAVARVLDDQTCGQIWLWREGRWQLFSEHCANRAKDP